MANTITCPNCGNSFEPTAALDTAITAAVKLEREEMVRKWKEAESKKQNEYQKREEDLAKQNAALTEERSKMNEELNKRLAAALSEKEKTMQQDLSKKIAGDFEEKLKSLEESKREQEEKLKESRKREIDFLKKEEIFTQKAQEQELILQRTINQERERIKAEEKKNSEALLREKEEQQSVKTKELEKQLQDQKVLIEEMKRKSEQGSMQMQGEAKELLVEEILGELFPFDTITKSRKGVEETDLTHEVINDFRHPCGKIVYEIKNTKAWSEKWLDKLKIDMRNGSAEAAVIVSKALPKDCDGFMQKEGIWICNHDSLRIVAVLLRDGLTKLYEANKKLENVSDKKERLYKYMTSTEFRQKWEAIIGVYTTMQSQLTKERVQAQKHYSEREKQLQIMMANAVGFVGDVKGLGGMEMMEIRMIGEEE